MYFYLRAIPKCELLTEHFYCKIKFLYNRSSNNKPMKVAVDEKSVFKGRNYEEALIVQCPSSVWAKTKNIMNL